MRNRLWKHFQIHHGGELRREDLEMKVVKTHRSPLSRQIHEGVEIEVNKADLLMNSKSEWNQSRLPRIVIESGETLMEDEESGLGRSGEKRKERTRLKMSKKIVNKRQNELGEERETWEQYKKRKLGECQTSAENVEKMLKVRERANGKRGLLTRAGLPGGEGERLDEWGHLTGVGPPSGDEEKLIETQKNKTTNQVFIEKGPFKFTFRKEVAKVIENEVKKGGLSKAKRILSENIERENKTSKLPTEELEDGGKLKKIEIMIEMMIEEIVIEGEKRIEEKMKRREIRKYRAKEKQTELKERLVNRAVETLIQKVVDKIEWRNDIEEEIGKDREREKIQECTENILRKRKSNKKLKYKVKKMEGSVEKGESKEICDKKHRKYEKARRRKRETEKGEKKENEDEKPTTGWGETPQSRR